MKETGEDNPCQIKPLWVAHSKISSFVHDIRGRRSDFARPRPLLIGGLVRDVACRDWLEETLELLSSTYRQYFTIRINVSALSHISTHSRIKVFVP